MKDWCSHRCRLIVGLTALGLAPASVADGARVVYTRAQSLYLEGCGGCHGILGNSARESIPELRDTVGWFLCTAQGREYIVRLPNVAFAAASDAELAEMLNFVTFGLGADSAPVGAQPYSAAEVGRLRRRPLKNQPLAKVRAEIVRGLAQHCERRQGRVVFRD